MPKVTCASSPSTSLIWLLMETLVRYLTYWSLRRQKSSLELMILLRHCYRAGGLGLLPLPARSRLIWFGSHRTSRCVNFRLPYHLMSHLTRLWRWLTANVLWNWEGSHRKTCFFIIWICNISKTTTSAEKLEDLLFLSQRSQLPSHLVIISSGCEEIPLIGVCSALKGAAWQVKWCDGRVLSHGAHRARAHQ